MGILDKLLHRDAASGDEVASAPASCPHGVLMPRWDSVQDMGSEERISSYRCDSCGESFSRDEADMLRATTVARLRDLSEQPSVN